MSYEGGSMRHIYNKVENVGEHEGIKTKEDDLLGHPRNKKDCLVLKKRYNKK